MMSNSSPRSTDLYADAHNLGKLNASAKFRASEHASRYPRVPVSQQIRSYLIPVPPERIR